MIVVTGTKRSGTSMWMQILAAAGIRVVGEAYSRGWEESIKEANRRGFHESLLRRGIYYATNPHPRTGAWLNPKASRHLAVKVFVPGIVRSDYLYLSRVIASIRPFRQYAASLARLHEMEAESRKKRGKEGPPRAYLDPILEWWLENFLLIRDVTTRGYPARLVAYESVLENPQGVLSEIFSWLGVGDFEAACRAVHPEDRTQNKETVSDLTHPQGAVFDELYERIKVGTPFDAEFLGRLNETHEALLPEITQALAVLAEARSHMKRRASGPLSPDRLDALLHPEGPSPQSSSPSS